MHHGRKHFTYPETDPALLVELELQPQRFPVRGSFMPLVERLAQLGRLDAIELALAPGGCGRLGFLVYGAQSLKHVRERLAEFVGAEGIVRCATHAA